MANESEDIEAGCLGAILVAAQGEDDTGRIFGVYDRKGLTAEWFRNGMWRRLWESIHAEWNDHHSVDVLLVSQRFGQGGGEAIMRAIDACPTSAHAEYYIDKLRDVHLYVKCHQACREVLRDLQPGNVSFQLDVLANKIREVQGLAARADGGLTKVGDHSAAIMKDLNWLHEERFVKKNRRAWIGLPMPWEILNVKYQGLKPGIHVIAALPSQGKTTMGVAISLFWCQQKIKHGFFCIDMRRDELVKRYACLLNQVSLSKLQSYGSLEDIERFRKGMETVGALDSVEMSESYMIERVRDEIYRGVYTHGWKAVIIDYLQLLDDNFRGSPATYEKVKHVTLAVKQIAKDVGVPIIALVQLARAFAKENRDTNRRPGLDDLGDSAEIARAASTVAVLAGDNLTREWWKEHLPRKLAYADPKNEIASSVGQEHLAKQLRPVWFYMIKNQQGMIGDVPMVMYPNYFMFRPGDWDAEPEVVSINGKDRKCEHLKFETLRDDWIHADGDEILEHTGAMGYRGIEYDSDPAPQQSSFKV